MPVTTDDARAFIAQVRWQFAKTMPQWPHEYTVREWRPDLEREFFEFVVLIRRDGVVKPWPRDAARPRYHLTYLELDGWEYWTMGAPVPETTVINRARPSYEPLTMEEAEDFTSRTAWRSARSTEDVAPHQYVVQKRGQRRDDFTEEEFWRMVELVKTKGRRELWTPPGEWVRRWGGKPMKNKYLYIGEYAYWFTCPYGAVPMLNREHISVQERDQTRTVLGE